MTTRDDIEARKKEMQPWYWWGIPTFFKCPWNEDPADCDIALIGVPHSAGNGSTERDQHLGPRTIRHVSGRLRRAHQAFGLIPWDELKIHDLGDVPLPQAMNNEVSVDHIEDYYRLVDASGARPVSFGGDHAITGPILKGPGRTGRQVERRAEGRPGPFRRPPRRLRPYGPLARRRAFGRPLGRLYGP